MALSPLFYQEIQQHKLFNPLPDDACQHILQDSGLITLSKNEILFECGFEARNFFLVRTGQIIFFQISANGHEKIIDIFEAGECFAIEIMFLEQQRYPINARATCSTELFYFDSQKFKTLLQGSNDLCFTMMAEMSNRLKNQTQEIIELSIHDAQHRLIRYLLEKSCNDNIQSCQPVVILSTTKSLLASRLSVTPETFSRVLTRLKNQGLIRIKDDAITLTNPEKLIDLVNHKSKLHTSYNIAG